MCPVYVQGRSQSWESVCSIMQIYAVFFQGMISLQLAVQRHTIGTPGIPRIQKLSNFIKWVPRLPKLQWLFSESPKVALSRSEKFCGCRVGSSHGHPTGKDSSDLKQSYWRCQHDSVGFPGGVCCRRKHRLHLTGDFSEGQLRLMANCFGAVHGGPWWSLRYERRVCKEFVSTFVSYVWTFWVQQLLQPGLGLFWEQNFTHSRTVKTLFGEVMEMETQNKIHFSKSTV